MKRLIFLSFLILVWQAMPAQCTAPTITASGPTTICPRGSITLSTPVIGNTWTQKADFGGVAREDATSFSIGNKGYTGTGSQDINHSFFKDFWEYDPSTNAWTQKADFGGGERGYATGFSIGNKGYIGMGYGNFEYRKDFWEYDPATNRWTQKADFGGTARTEPSGFSIDSKGYIGVGYSNGIYDKDFWEYNPTTNAWVQKADFGGTARDRAVGFSINSRGYIGTGDAVNNGYTKDFWEYNPTSDTWIQKADFGGAARSLATGFSIGSKGYIGTGGNDTKDFWEYDPSTNMWTQKANFGGEGRYRATGFSIGSKGYIGMGLNGYNSFRKDFWEYDPGYTYSWSPGGQTTPSITVSTAGSYTVTATNSLGCSATSAATMVTVNTPATPVITASGSTVLCPGNSVTLTSSAAASYQWYLNGNALSGATSQSYLVTTAGSYTVTTTNATGCSATSAATTVTVNTPVTPVITTSGSTTFCPGGSVLLNSSSATTYQWYFNNTAISGATSQSYTATGAGNYTVTTTNASGCSATSSPTLITVSTPVTPVITASGPTTICAGSSVTLTSSAATTYQWYVNNTAISGATSQSYMANNAGSYSVTTTNAAGCPATSAATFVTVNTPVTPIITAPGGTAICPGGGSVTLAAPAGNTWIQKADFGGGERFGAIGFSIGSKGYMGTGISSVISGGYSKDFWEYDPATSVWTQKADFGGAARSYAVGFSIGSKGYIGTGVDGHTFYKDFWEYDPVANLWAQKADFGGAARCLSTSFSIGSKGYIGTGVDGYTANKDFWEYDPATNAWNQKADFGGAARYYATSFSIGSKGYIGTGFSSSYTKDFWEYNPATDAWVQKTDFGGAARNAATGFSIGSKGYIGTGANGSYMKDFWEYNPATNGWAQKADFGGAARYFAASFSIGSKGYVGTGEDDNSIYKDFWEYDPGYTYSWSPGGQTTASITVSTAGNYTVTTTNVLGCSATSAVTKVTAYSSTVLYVDSSKTTSGDGSSWANAFKEVRDALYAASQCSSITTINVAKGTYKPTNDTNRDSAFAILRSGLKIYGGYPTGGGTRNSTTNPTILSGDIGTTGNASDNSYHVLVVAGLTNSTDSLVFDGFTVSGGNANGTGSKTYNGATLNQNEGGGIYLNNNSTGTTIRVRNCRIASNMADNDGGGWCNQSSYPAITNCLFTGNTNSAFGSAIANLNGSQAVITACVFTANSGRVMYNSFSSPSVTNCLFASNSAFGNGSAMYNANSSSVVTNCTFTLNTTTGNGTIFNENASTPQFANCIIWGNTALDNGGFRNNVSTPTVTYSDVQGGYSGTGNISSDPRFVNPADADGPDNIYGTADDGIALQLGSPAINTGSNAAVPAGVTTDITGAARIQNTTVDMGAYEAPDCSYYTTVYVDGSISTSGNGLSWATAFKTVQQALDASNSCSGVKQVWIKKGTYYPTAYATNCTDCATNGTTRDYTFALRDGLALYGGFAGTETDTTQRVAGNTTLLSGDIGTPNNNSDNCYHVLLAINSNNRLNGLTITGGNANDNGVITVAGQTIYHSNGGGMYQYGGSSSLYNCTFTGNAASSEGGGMYTVYSSGLRIKNSRYLNNHSGAGGAIRLLYGNTSFVSVNNVYAGNTANFNDGGALSLVMGSGTDTLINNVFIKNVASGSAAINGGGALVQEDGTNSYIVNNTFYADSAASNGGAVRFKAGGSNRYVYNNIFYKSYNGTSNTDVSLESGTSITAQSNNLYSNTNPLFVNEANPAGADNVYGTSDDGLQLQVSSPAINVGSNTAAAGIATDITGAARIQGYVVDMGAYENNAVILPLTLLQFGGKATNNSDGLLTWRTANEVNVSHFELQRSGDGRSFNVIRMVQAKGTAQSETDYSYTDKNLPAGVYYYRLRMVDKDGKETYSAVVTIVLKSSNAITLYPVPAKEAVWLSGSAANLPGTNALLMDVQGRVLQSIRISQWPQRIDVSNLAAGTYLVKVEGVKAMSFIKQ